MPRCGWNLAHAYAAAAQFQNPKAKSKNLRGGGEAPLRSGSTAWGSSTRRRWPSPSRKVATTARRGPYRSYPAPPTLRRPRPAARPRAPATEPKPPRPTRRVACPAAISLGLLGPTCPPTRLTLSHPLPSPLPHGLLNFAPSVTAASAYAPLLSTPAARDNFFFWRGGGLAICGHTESGAWQLSLGLLLGVVVGITFTRKRHQIEREDDEGGCPRPRQRTRPLREC